MQNVTVTTEFIKLQQFLKLANIVAIGSEAKYLIQEGLISVNGEVCTMRGKKIYHGDVISFDGKEYVSVGE